MADTYPAIAYAKLDASEKKTQKSVDDDVEKGVIVMVHAPENLALIHGCSAWACCLLLVQIVRFMSLLPLFFILIKMLIFFREPHLYCG